MFLPGDPEPQVAQPGVPGWGQDRDPRARLRWAPAQEGAGQQGGTAARVSGAVAVARGTWGVPGGESLSAITCVTAVTSALLPPLLRACKERFPSSGNAVTAYLQKQTAHLFQRQQNSTAEKLPGKYLQGHQNSKSSSLSLSPLTP